MRVKQTTFRIATASIAFACGLTMVWLFDAPRAYESLLGANKFTPTYRACKPGYRQGYRLPDGREMAEGSACFKTPEAARSELQTRIAQASRVIERIPNYKNRSGREGERIVVVYPSGESGKEQASILWYGGDDCFLYIDAPSLGIAREFEKADAYAY